MEETRESSIQYSNWHIKKKVICLRYLISHENAIVQQSTLFAAVENEKKKKKDK
jgi:DNA-binding winged helix-turn-helix (wHTH) protein